MKHLAIVAAFIAVGLAVYGASLSSEFIAFDDHSLVYENPAIREITPASITWAFTHFDPELYIPLTFVSYQIDYAIAGLSPFQFHMQNLILHILNALLIVVFIRMLTGANRWSMIAGLLFLSHPLNTEAVMWVSARKDLLSSVFFLVSLIGYLKYRNGSAKWYVASIIAFAVGLLAKVSIILLPGVLLCIDLWKQRTWNRSITIDKIPYGLLSLLFGVIALFGKRSVLGDSSFVEGLLVAIRSTAFYLQKFFVPVHLSIVYPQTDPVTLLNPQFTFSALVTIAIIGTASYLRSAKVWAALGIAFLLLFPSFFNYAKGGDIYFASDRYFYLPMVGVLLLIVLLLMHLKQQRVVSIVAACVIILFSVLAYHQAHYWNNTRTLFTHVLDLYEQTYFAHTKIAAFLIDDGKEQEALRHLHRSIELKPTGRAYYNLGIIALQHEHNDEALTMLKKAVELNPNLSNAHMNLGYLYFLKGDMQQAISNAEQAVLLAPQDHEAARNLAGIYSAAGRTEEARALLNRLSEKRQE